jgi:hypothetical protein
MADDSTALRSVVNLVKSVKFVSADEAAGYLSGMMDGEGSVSPEIRRICIHNTEPAIVAATLAAALYLDLQPRLKVTHGNPCFGLFFYGQENQTRFYEVTRIRSEKKRRKLVELLASYKNPIKADELISEEVLRDLYVNKYMTTREIAAKFGLAGHSSINRLLRKYSIPARPNTVKTRNDKDLLLIGSLLKEMDEEAQLP